MSENGQHKDGFLMPEVADEQALRAEEAERRRLANLTPFEPGISGNPAGRRRGGLYVTEWMNIMLASDSDGRPRFSKTDLQAVIEDQNAPPAKIIAARQIMVAMSDPQKWVKDRRGRLRPAGHDPEVGRAFERIMDRLEGKPVATLHVERNDPPASKREMLERLAAMVEHNPALNALLNQFVARRVPNLAAPAAPGSPGGPGPRQHDPASPNAPILSVGEAETDA